MIRIGINGFGRIGKAILNQVLDKQNIRVNAINFPGFDIRKIESYINNDSYHKTPKRNVQIVSDNKVNINGNIIEFFDARIPNKNMWKYSDSKYVFETTGKFLTESSATQHNADYIIMCAPSKDNIVPQYLYNGNHLNYNGEKIVSNSSCTTNCIVPLIKLLNEKYGIEHCNFITVHAATASQSVLDNPHLKKRNHRSVFNNIIPATTGASKSAIKILPELNGKIYGTSVRVPTGNVSMVDMNIRLIKKDTLSNILEFLRGKDEIIVSDDEHLVSSDFCSTENPTIVDSNACLEMGDNDYKFTIWYDNEWSYSSQALKLLNYIHEQNNLPVSRMDALDIGIARKNASNDLLEMN
uniref:Glyceraldehyde 3-phosphate dehydrogenase NAD(P) binding domain-containing protein n=1 Tax=viral metagenome TaxID=1070528 RepID=A0A6C0L3W8_9ZZZZ|tara:strand:+ start:2499 stop:3560 length:1062 start_codon:yes stop_codon:yes gene_type:complete